MVNKIIQTKRPLLENLLHYVSRCLVNPRKAPVEPVATLLWILHDNTRKLNRSGTQSSTESLIRYLKILWINHKSDRVI